jgi:hypothetical protein
MRLEQAAPHGVAARHTLAHRKYLQTEFTALSQAIELKYPNAEQRWALVAYRDTSDTYLTRWYDFRDDDR